MAVILGMGAIAIDISQWYGTRHQAQTAADSAALAGANCMADGGTSASTSCGLVPGTYASDNGMPSSTVQFNAPAAGEVTVTVTAKGANVFGTSLGITPPTYTEQAVATWQVNPSACTTNCSAIFAMGAPTGGTCPTDITLNGKGDTTLGIVHANGSISENGTGQSLGTVSYGPTVGGCSYSPSSGSTPTVANATSEAPITSWPTDYSTILTACGGTGEVACTGPSGTPAYCTQAAANFTFSASPSSGQVWCAYGTGNPTNPADYTGAINFGSQNETATGTWIGGTINVGAKGDTLSVPTTTPTYPLFYASSSGLSCGNTSPITVPVAVCMTGQNAIANGDIFAPTGTIVFNGAGSTLNFLEAQAIDFVGGSVTGDGPNYAGSGTVTGPGTDQLTQ